MRLATLGLAAVWAAYFAFALSDGGLGLDRVMKTYVFSGMLVAAALICLARATLVGRERASWALLGTGMLLWAGGSVYWSAVLAPLEAPPYPSIADALYLGFYPPCYVALMLLVRRDWRRISPSVWLDGLIASLAVSAVGAAFVIPVIVTDTSGSVAVVATNIAYPLADLVLIALVVGAAALGSWRPGRAWTLIGIGLLLFAVADTIYLAQVAQGTFVEGAWLDAIWPAGMLLLAVAAWQAPPRTATHGTRGVPVLAVPLPLMFTLAAVAILIHGNVAGVNIAATALASATIVAAVVRLGLSFRELRSLAETRRQATTDDLTGLPNRRYFYGRARAAVDTASRTGEPFTLLVADIDRFKELNDTLGHQAGDMLLQQIGPRLRDALRARDTLARLGGDEFAVLLPGLDASSAHVVVDDLQAILEQPFALRGLTLLVEASFGVASFPEHAGDLDTLIRHADVAMYQAKEAGTGCEVYSADRDPHSRDRLGLLGDLRGAIDRGELELHYQPKVELRSQRVTGVEALVRWRHPERGLLPPGEFLPLAERTSLMRPLTMHVLDTALAQCRAWADRGLDLTVAVNLAVPNLLDTRLAGDVADRLSFWDIAPSQLRLEVTENVVVSDPARVIEVLTGLRALGVTLSLDDFGTGSSSLAYLTRLPLDELKIDKSFVLGMESSRADEMIVRSTTELAQRLGLRVVAEGVETAFALARLTEAGCEEAQGFFLQRPVPADELETWLAAWAEGSALRRLPDAA